MTHDPVDGTVMERKTFFEHYRICVNEDGSPQELNRTGTAITYKGIDFRSGEAVALKCIQLAHIEPTTLEQFEEQARAAQQLDHITIAKLRAFGIEGDDFVYVSEYSHGETVDSWVAAHGPMPPDAVLRIALQVVDALNAASFHGLRHRAIQPSNLLIVPGETAEGGWPFVKLMNFGLNGVKAGVDGSNTSELDPSVAPTFASPEQLQHGPVDFRSEIYSLGATMCFLLTGTIHSAETRLRQLRRFPTALRDLLTHILRKNPDERPQDAGVFTEEIRECLVRIERRQALARRFGVPFAPTIARAIPPHRAWLPRRTLAVAALVLTLATLAAVLLPEPMILHRFRATKSIGVPVGVPEASPVAVVQNAPPPVAPALALPASAIKAATAAPIETTPPPNQAAPASTPVVANANPNTPVVAHPVPTPGAQESPPSAPLVAAEPDNTSSNEVAAIGRALEPVPPAEAPGSALAPPSDLAAQQNVPTEDPNVDAKVPSGDTAIQSRSSNKGKSSASNRAASKKAGKTKSERSTAGRSTFRTRRNVAMTQSRNYQSRLFVSTLPEGPGTFRTRFLGTTPDGRWILGLPSGEITTVRAPSTEQYAPPEPLHRRIRRTIFRRPRILPPPPFVPIYPPDA